MSVDKIGPYSLNSVAQGDSSKLVQDLPDASIDIVITSPPYWGQRMSEGNGVEEDPRNYVERLCEFFSMLLPKMKEDGLLWLNIGDAYNTPINWREDDYSYSTLGPGRSGLDRSNSAYTKPRFKRRAFIEKNEPWLSYGSLLALPYRMVIGMCDDGWLFRGEVVWRKRNPMPEGRCRRPHRQHESIYMFAKQERHGFRTSPPVGSVWEFPNEKVEGVRHRSRFPEELPRRCLAASVVTEGETVVLDPFSGSATTGVAAIRAGARYVGFEVDEEQAVEGQGRLNGVLAEREESDGEAAD